MCPALHRDSPGELFKNNQAWAVPQATCSPRLAKPQHGYVLNLPPGAWSTQWVENDPTKASLGEARGKITYHNNQ